MHKNATVKINFFYTIPEISKIHVLHKNVQQNNSDLTTEMVLLIIS